MVTTLILRVLDHHSVLFIVIKSLAHTQTQGEQEKGGIFYLLKNYYIALIWSSRASKICSIKTKQHVSWGTVTS